MAGGRVGVGERRPRWSSILWNFIDAPNGSGNIVLKPLCDPSTMMRLQTAAANVVHIAASRPQDHWCPGTFPDCVVEHHWLCKTCEFSWTSRFHPLLV